jgi:hypothetical protein
VQYELAIVMFDEEGFEYTLAGRGEISLQATGLLGKSDQSLLDLGVELLTEQRQDRVTDTVAGVGIGVVGGIVAKGDRLFPKVTLDLGPSDPEERSDKPDITAFADGADAPDTGQSPEAGPAKDAVKDRLGVIVGVMGKRDDLEVEFEAESLEELEPGLACGLLDGRVLRLGSGGHIHRLHGAWTSEIPGEVLHELSVGVGIGPAKPMIQVSDVERDGPFLALVERAEQVQQGYGVRATRNGHEHRFVMREETTLFDDLGESVL